MTQKKGTKHRTYTDTERLGLMFMALHEGTTAVSEAHGVPIDTIRTWFKRDAEGITQMRQWLQEHVGQSFLRSQSSIYTEVERRTRELSEEELMETYRALAGQGKQPASPVSVNVTQQQAQVGAPNGNLSEAERAYLAALAGEPSVAGGQDAPVAAGRDGGKS
jgi:hypothetical protein